MVAAVGITITGEKVLLGFVQTATENRKVCAAFLRELVDRGLRTDLGLLVVTDGAKGLHAAVREGFGDGGPGCSAVSGIRARRSWPIFRSVTGRPCAGSCRRRMSSRRTRPPRARWERSAPNWSSSMPPQWRAWTRAWRRRSLFITSASFASWARA